MPIHTFNFFDAGGGLILATCLIMLSYSDIKELILPDWLNLLLAIFGVMFSALTQQPNIIEAVIASIISVLIFGLVRTLHLQWRRKEGLGLGDVKLVGAGGFWIGLEGVPIMLLIATSTALLFIGFQHMRGHKLKAETAIPFGPFLCLGIFAAWFFNLSCLIRAF